MVIRFQYIANCNQVFLSVKIFKAIYYKLTIIKYCSTWSKIFQKKSNKLNPINLSISTFPYTDNAPNEVRKVISEGIFNSVLVYCHSKFGGMDKGDLRDLQILQNKAAQIVTRSPPRAEIVAMYDQLHWLTVN